MNISYLDSDTNIADESLKSNSENPFLWQYKGKSVLLWGGNWQDNFFNHPSGLVQHLDRLVECGGNEPDNSLLSLSEENEAYCIAEVTKQFGIFFPEEGSVSLDLSNTDGKWTIRWLIISQNQRLENVELVDVGKCIPLQTPGVNHCVALVLPGDHEMIYLKNVV